MKKAEKKKPRCAVKLLVCRRTSVGRFTGTEKGDPVFQCCLACLAMLRRQGVRLRQVSMKKA